MIQEKINSYLIKKINIKIYLKEVKHLEIKIY